MKESDQTEEISKLHPQSKAILPVQHSNYFNVIQHNCTTVKMEAASFSENLVTSYQSQHLHISQQTQNLPQEHM